MAEPQHGDVPLFLNIFGPLNGDEPIVTLTPEQVEAGT